MGRRYRRAKRAMRPNRIAARFISGGKHQTFSSIARSPFRLKTVTSNANRREQYQALERRERQAAQAQRRRQRREAQRERKQAAAARKGAPKPPRPPRPKSPPIAVNPRTGKPITYAQAMKALREAQERAERLAAGLDGDPPAKRTRAPEAAANKTDPASPSRRPAPQTRRKAAARKTTARAPRRQAGVIPDPALAPGKNLRGLYLALTCPCQGTGRIATITTDGRVTGSTSCPRHGRKARGARKTFARRALTDAGLPGLAAWLASREGGNRDKQQQRVARQAERHRYAGPTEQCRACDEGIVNRDLTEKLREQYVERALADHEAAGRKTPSVRKLEAQARKAYPLDHCRECAGLARVPSQHAGDWYRHTNLPQRHRLTAREAATGKQRKR